MIYNSYVQLRQVYLTMGTVPENSEGGSTVNLYYKSHQIPKLKCFLYPHAVVFAQFIEARC